MRIAASVRTSSSVQAALRRMAAAPRGPSGGPCRARSAGRRGRARRAAGSGRAPRRRPATWRRCRGTGSRRRASAQARQPRSAASSQRRARRARSGRRSIWILPASSPTRRRQRHAAGHEDARQVARRRPAPASSPAGPCRTSPTPSTPRRRGSERISRRKTIAASLRYGRLSIMPGRALRAAVAGVGDVAGERQRRPPPSAPRPPPARAGRPPSGRCGSPSAIGVPSSARRPPWVLRIRNGSRPTSDGSQPMPAFWVRPNRSPRGPVAEHLVGQRQRALGAWRLTSGCGSRSSSGRRRRLTGSAQLYRPSSRAVSPATSIRPGLASKIWPVERST